MFIYIYLLWTWHTYKCIARITNHHDLIYLNELRLKSILNIFTIEFCFLYFLEWVKVKRCVISKSTSVTNQNTKNISDVQSPEVSLWSQKLKSGDCVWQAGGRLKCSSYFDNIFTIELSFLYFFRMSEGEEMCNFQIDIGYESKYEEYFRRPPACHTSDSIGNSVLIGIFPSTNTNIVFKSCNLTYKYIARITNHHDLIYLQSPEVSLWSQKLKSGDCVWRLRIKIRRIFQTSTCLSYTITWL
jgi:hypothetical protein